MKLNFAIFDYIVNKLNNDVSNNDVCNITFDLVQGAEEEHNTSEDEDEDEDKDEDEDEN